jgi:hypothetical protein
MNLNHASKKYVDVSIDNNDHYYQNHISNTNKRVILKPNSQDEEKNHYINGFHTILHQNPNNNSHLLLSPPSNHVQSMYSTSTHTSSSAASSPTSDNRGLLLARKQPHKLNLPYCLLVFAIIFLTSSLISIAITFIFPFWIRLSIENSTQLLQVPPRRPPQTFSNNLTFNQQWPLLVEDGYLNITNYNYNLCLLTMNFSNTDEDVSTQITFDLGLWEVKMQQELEFFDLNTRTIVSRNAYPQSMLWLNSDVNNFQQSFLIKLLQFIDLKQSYVFMIQILEILHFIFSFLTVSFTSYTLCLCTGHKSSLCWYFACCFLCIIAFSLGTAVLILIILWPLGENLILKTQFFEEYKLVKTFGWCFWYSVGINSIMCLAVVLILIYLIISSITIYQHNRLTRQKLNRGGVRSDVTDSSGIINGFKSTSSIENFRPSIMNTTNTMGVQKIYQNNIPETYQKRMSLTEINSGSVPTFNVNLLASNNNNNPTLTKSQFDSNSILNQQQFQSPSYIFYTGNGNFRTHSFKLDDENLSLNGGISGGGGGQQLPPSQIITDFLLANNNQSSSLMNYAMLMQSNHQSIINENNLNHFSGLNGPNSNNANHENHQYSNLPTNDLKLTTYR